MLRYVSCSPWNLRKEPSVVACLVLSKCNWYFFPKYLGCKGRSWLQCSRSNNCLPAWGRLGEVIRYVIILFKENFKQYAKCRFDGTTYISLSVKILVLSFFSESRYLLILTENYAALPIFQQHLQSVNNAIIIFGSSFPKDQEYTQVNIQMFISHNDYA